MSTHPNAIILLVLTPDDLSRRTMKNILAESSIQQGEPEEDPDDDIEIGGLDYHHKVMEADYLENWQISAKEGDLIFFDMITYGYGERILWADVEKRKNDLEEWAKGICARHHCTFEIYITANYW